MDKRSLYDGLNEFEEDLQKLSQNLIHHTKNVMMD